MAFQELASKSKLKVPVLNIFAVLVAFFFNFRSRIRGTLLHRSRLYLPKSISKQCNFWISCL